MHPACLVVNALTAPFRSRAHAAAGLRKKRKGDFGKRGKRTVAEARSVAIRRQSLLTGVLCACAALIVALGWQNHALREALDEAAPKPRVGQWVPSHPARTYDGRTLVLGRPASALQLVYVFTPDCPHCKASEEAIALVERRAAQARMPVELVGLSAAPDDRLAAYAQARRTAFPVVRLDAAKLFSLFQLNIVPALVAVDRDGYVRHVQIGEIVGEDGASRVLQAIDAALGKGKLKAN
jgi:peroxiredoxin